MADDPKESEIYSEEETVARREAALKRAFATPHKPHEKLKKTPARPKPRRVNSGQKKGEKG